MKWRASGAGGLSRGTHTQHSGPTDDVIVEPIVTPELQLLIRDKFTIRGPRGEITLSGIILLLLLNLVLE